MGALSPGLETFIYFYGNGSMLHTTPLLTTDMLSQYYVSQSHYSKFMATAI